MGTVRTNEVVDEVRGKAAGLAVLIFSLGFWGAALPGCGSSSSGGGGGGACASGPGLCSNGDSSSCRCGTTCLRTCATCNYYCEKLCTSEGDCEGFTASDGAALTCSSCPEGVCNAGFSACYLPSPSGTGGSGSGGSGTGGSGGNLCGFRYAPYDQYCAAASEPPHFYTNCSTPPPAGCVEITSNLDNHVACYANEPCYCCP